MRQAGDETFEDTVSGCKNLQDLRKAAEKKPEFRTEALDSVAPVKILLSQVFERLQLKEKSIQMSVAAPQPDIDSLWQSLSTMKAPAQVQTR